MKIQSDYPRSGLARRRLLALGLLSGIGAVSLAACTGDQTVVEVRSLERTQSVAFLCLGEPGSAAALRPLSDCTDERFSSASNFGSDRSLAHLYALVTLETRGELAMLDLSATEGRILDQDPSTPGETSLPIGAQPTALVTSPKGTAAFVSSAEIGRPGIYALSSEHLRPCEVDDTRCETRAPAVSDWPACRLSSPPGEMIWMSDPAVAGQVRASCDGTYADVDTSAPAFGDLDREGAGRQKLVVALPKEGRIVVVDAQSLLARTPGSFDDCPIETSVDLVLDATPAQLAVRPIAPGPACALPPARPEVPQTPPSGGSFVATPSGFALGGGRLYVGDISAPRIHVIDASSPCTLQELAPLSPVSAEDPSRIVLTSKLAVMNGVTPSLKRYLYAIDVADRSVMAFDVSEGALVAGPLNVGRPEFNPLQPPDRIRFAAAPNDVLIMQRDEPRSTGQGLAPFGTLCDPRPEAVVCDTNTTSCDAGTAYRATDDYEDGAGPFQLRGSFALVALASGQLAAIDVEDYDAACRGPKLPLLANGCASDGTIEQATTNEPSCGMVIPNTPRSGVYMVTNEEVGRNQPGLQSFPILSLDDGTVVSQGPRMRAVSPAAGAMPRLAVGSELLDINPTNGAISDADGPKNTLRINLEDPRVHQIDQEWTVTYQGALPAFVGKKGDLRLGSDRSLQESSGGFCRGGTQSEASIRAKLAEEGLIGAALDQAARRLADRVHISERLGNVESPYWDTAACTYSLCRTTFGDAETPTPARDILISEAYEDQLKLGAPNGVSDELFECCFPTLVSYEIRPGDEWIVSGGGTGFLHSVIADPVSGECRPSCDPRLGRRSARVRSLPGLFNDENNPNEDPIVSEANPGAYLGPNFRFVILVPPVGSMDPTPSSKRDMAFRFFTQGSFVPLRGVLTSENRPTVTPQQLVYLRQTDELVITDGGLEGVLFAPGDLNGNLRQYF